MSTTKLDVAGYQKAIAAHREGYANNRKVRVLGLVVPAKEYRRTNSQAERIAALVIRKRILVIEHSSDSGYWPTYHLTAFGPGYSVSRAEIKTMEKFRTVTDMLQALKGWYSNVEVPNAARQGHISAYVAEKIFAMTDETDPRKRTYGSKVTPGNKNDFTDIVAVRNGLGMVLGYDALATAAWEAFGLSHE